MGYVTDIPQANVVIGYTRGSYSIRSRGVAEPSNWITAECYPVTTLACGLTSVYYTIHMASLCGRRPGAIKFI